MTLGVYTAKACKCQGSENIQEEFEQTSVVVSGKVLNKCYVSYESTLNNQDLELIRKEYESKPERLNAIKSESIVKIELEVNYTYKGDGITDKIIIYTSRFGASCGYLGFEIGQNFIAYLSPKNYLDVFYKTSRKLNGTDEQGVFWTNQCRWTKMFDEMEDKELRKLMNG